MRGMILPIAIGAFTIFSNVYTASGLSCNAYAHYGYNSRARAGVPNASVQTLQQCIDWCQIRTSCVSTMFENNPADGPACWYFADPVSDSVGSNYGNNYNSIWNDKACGTPVVTRCNAYQGYYYPLDQRGAKWTMNPATTLNDCLKACKNSANCKSSLFDNDVDGSICYLFPDTVENSVGKNMQSPSFRTVWNDRDC